ncbi:MAG: hypothetical protein ACQGVC_05545 [Myxococcota bacterium]
MTPRIVWTVLFAVYALFFAWYTSFGGPLSDEEIARYTEVLNSQGIPPERLEVWLEFMRSDTGDDFAMLNALDLRDTPRPIEGVEPGETSEQVMAKYTEPFLGKALRSAAHPILLGRAAAPALDVWGIEGADRWTQGGLVRYRSRRDVMEQAVFASGLDIHDFKIAALEKTIAYPLDPFFYAGDPRLLLALVLLILGLLVQLRASNRRARVG